jgi:hypothetical protein
MTHHTHRRYALAFAAALVVGGVGSADAQTTETEAVRRAMDQLKKVEAAQRRPQSTNVRVEVLLTDKADGKTVSEERLTLLLTDWQEGSLRRNLPGMMPGWNRNFEVDARPVIVGNRIELRLRVNYQGPRDAAPQTENTKAIPEMVEFTESTTALVESGKPTTLIDAYGDPPNRRVSVQATATIVK